MFNYINIEKLKSNVDFLRTEWNSKKPFRYLTYENVLFEDKALEVLKNYPKPDDENWNNTTYINQKKKFQKTKFEDDSIFNELFKELNSKEFLDIISSITGINDLIPDNKLFGGGLHQSINGAFLDVHVDYNIHPETKLHRRLNILIYMNQDWKPKYEGYLELWDMSKKERIENISPDFNKLAMFETNQISYHGHPHPLNTPKDITRKSIATYYYTTDRDDNHIAEEHNTKYINTTGLSGKLKNLNSGAKALIERLKKKK